MSDSETNPTNQVPRVLTFDKKQHEILMEFLNTLDRSSQPNMPNMSEICRKMLTLDVGTKAGKLDEERFLEFWCSMVEELGKEKLYKYSEDDIDRMRNVTYKCLDYQRCCAAQMWGIKLIIGEMFGGMVGMFDKIPGLRAMPGLKEIMSKEVDTSAKSAEEQLFIAVRKCAVLGLFISVLPVIILGSSIISLSGLFMVGSVIKSPYNIIKELIQSDVQDKEGKSVAEEDTMSNRIRISNRIAKCIKECPSR